ncbi:MAG: hypothetical protein FWB85_10445 [Chitinispirillia bacterium]|nr:hypothetical protein [Chitinispirillia bacterium]MCL2242636.1 hypothetical protein [Chitinispirillia bacterium]
MLIVRKRNRKEINEKEKRERARKRAALLRLVCVSVLVAGLLGVFVYNNLDYISSVRESVGALLEKKEPAQAMQPVPPKEHKTATELLGTPEFFDDNNVKPLNNLIEELAAELAAAPDSAQAPHLQQALLTQVPPAAAKAPAKTDTAPHPLVSMTKPETEKVTPVPDKKTQYPGTVARPQSTPGQNMIAVDIDSVGTVFVSQKLTPEFWESLKPAPVQDSAEAWWMSMKGSAETWLTSQADAAKTWWASQAGMAKTWWTSLTDAAETWLESLLDVNPLKPKQNPAETEQVSPSAEPDLAGITQVSQASTPKPDAADVKQVSLVSTSEPGHAEIKQGSQAFMPKQDSADVRQAAQTPAPKPDTVKVNPEAGSMVISNILCRLADRSDISINVSVELYYDSRALQDETHSKRGALAAVLNSVVQRQEYGNVAMAALSGELLDAFNDVLKSGQLSNVDIRSFNVVQ